MHIKIATDTKYIDNRMVGEWRGGWRSDKRVAVMIDSEERIKSSD